MATKPTDHATVSDPEQDRVIREGHVAHTVRERMFDAMLRGEIAMSIEEPQLSIQFIGRVEALNEERTGFVIRSQQGPQYRIIVEEVQP